MLEVIRADHARRTLLMHAERLGQTSTDTNGAHPTATTLAQADPLGQVLDTLAGQFAPHPGSLPRTPVLSTPTRHSSEDALDGPVV